MPPLYRTAVLGGLLACTATGCSLLGLGDDEGITPEILRELQNRLRCQVEAVELGDDPDGELDDTCELDDGSFVDYYAFRIGGDGDEDARIELASADFIPFLTLADRDADVVVEDSNGDGDDMAAVEQSLGEGRVYIVAVRAVGLDATGDYTLRLERVGD